MRWSGAGIWSRSSVSALDASLHVSEPLELPVDHHTLESRIIASGVASQRTRQELTLPQAMLNVISVAGPWSSGPYAPAVTRLQVAARARRGKRAGQASSA